MKRPKVYIAAPFRADTVRIGRASGRAYGRIEASDKIIALQHVEDVFLQCGWATCLPHRDEGNWGEPYYEPDAIAPLCLRHVETSDLICAIPGRSRGVHIELGWAAARGIPIVAFVPDGDEPSTLLPGLGISASRTALPSQGELLIVRIPDLADIPRQLRDLLAAKPTDSSASECKALIDIGSNSIKMSVLSVREGRRPIPVGQLYRQSIGIANSVRSDGAVTPDRLRQLEEIFSSYSDIAASANASVTVVGTEALRRAKNLSDVEMQVKEAFGVRLQVLTQAQEAAAVVAAVRRTLHSNESVACLNLGASSVQLSTDICGDSDAYLLPFGTKDLTETNPWSRPLTSSEWADVRTRARHLIHSHIVSTVAQSKYLFHTGGELDFLLRCRVPMNVFRLSNEHVSLIDIADFQAFAEMFAARDPNEVAQATGLQGPWLEGAVASNAIAIEAAAATRARFLVPSNLNVIDGLVN